MARFSSLIVASLLVGGALACHDLSEVPIAGETDDGRIESASTECGWGQALDGQGVYVCGGNGADPSGSYPLSCPAIPQTGGPCPEDWLDVVGCCVDPAVVVRCVDGVVLEERCTSRPTPQTPFVAP